jgi:hypothetical protein
MKAACARQLDRRGWRSMGEVRIIGWRMKMLMLVSGALSRRYR